MLLIMVWHKLNMCFLYTNAFHCSVSRPLSHLQCDLGWRYAAIFSLMLLTTCFEGTHHSTCNSAKNKDASQKGGNKKHMSIYDSIIYINDVIFPGWGCHQFILKCKSLHFFCRLMHYKLVPFFSAHHLLLLLWRFSLVPYPLSLLPFQISSLYLLLVTSIHPCGWVFRYSLHSCHC